MLESQIARNARASKKIDLIELRLDRSQSLFSARKHVQLVSPPCGGWDVGMPFVACQSSEVAIMAGG